MKFKRTRKCRESSPKVTIKPTNQLISSQTDLLPISRFMERLDFNDKASKSLNVQQGKNRLYKAHQLIELLVVGVCAGARSVDKVHNSANLIFRLKSDARRLSQINILY